MRGRLTSDIDIDLDGVGNAMKRTNWATLRKSFVCSICSSTGLITHHPNDGVDSRVYFIDTTEMRINYFSAGKLFTANTFSKV